MAYIVSHNIVSSLGFSSEENVEKIFGGVSGIKKDSSGALSPVPVYVSLVKNGKNTEKNHLFASEEKQFTDYEQLLFLSLHKMLKESEIDLCGENTVWIFSTAKGNVNLLSKAEQHPFSLERLKLWKSSEVIAKYFGHRGKILTISTACISGTLALVTAQRLLESGKYAHALVVGADILPEFTCSGFRALKAVSETPCRPFDKKRSGMTPGEAAAVLLLSNEKKYASQPHVSILGGSGSNDANHISAPSRTGEGLTASIKNTLKQARLTAADIDYISTHGTATIFNDASEAHALANSSLNEVPANSVKGYTGHTFGAAGILESILIYESMKNNRVYSSLGFEEPGTDAPLNIIQNVQNLPLNICLKTASGFGGSNASLILGRETFEKQKRYTENPTSCVVLKQAEWRKNKIIADGKTIITGNPESTFDDLAKSAYKALSLSYPKFFKMDRPCKLAFITGEVLMQQIDNRQIIGEETGLILSTSSGSLDTDAAYQKTIDDRQNYYPAPSMFVYTLPNIMAGELSIRHGIKGENIVFMEEDFDKNFLFEYAQLLFTKGVIKNCIVGRVEYPYPQGEYIASLYFLTKIRLKDLPFPVIF